MVEISREDMVKAIITIIDSLEMQLEALRGYIRVLYVTEFYPKEDKDGSTNNEPSRDKSEHNKQ